MLSRLQLTVFQYRDLIPSQIANDYSAGKDSPTGRTLLPSVQLPQRNLRALLRPLSVPGSSPVSNNSLPPGSSVSSSSSASRIWVSAACSRCSSQGRPAVLQRRLYRDHWSIHPSQIANDYSAGKDSKLYKIARESFDQYAAINSQRRLLTWSNSEHAKWAESRRLNAIKDAALPLAPLKTRWAGDNVLDHGQYHSEVGSLWQSFSPQIFWSFT